MLVLQRKIGEAVVVGGDVTITVVDVRGPYVRLGITADKSVPVHRQEVADAIRRERGDA